MGFVANVLTVLIASPGDVTVERDLVTEELQLWNAANGIARQLLLFPIRWETHSSPQMGEHPQAVLNQQILAQADVLVGIFGTRIGTATPEYISGSVEEIKRHVAAGKLAMIYFSKVPVDPNALDLPQWKALQQFKEECRSGGLYAEFETQEQFKRDFGHHLSIELNKPKYLWVQRPQSPEQETAEPVLSDLERDLLISTSEDSHGSLMVGTTMDGFYVQTNNKNFGDGTPRRAAALKRGLENLAASGYLIREGDELYEITEEGYTRAEREATAGAALRLKLGDRAVALLKAGAAAQGRIMHMTFTGGEEIHVGGKGVIGNGDPRRAAEWREGLEELVEKKLVVSRSKSLYELTAAGYRMAEEFGTGEDASAVNAQNPTPAPL